MRRALTFILTILTLASCHWQGAILSQQEDQQADSLAWHVAVLPVMDCLPVYYASERGLFDSVGLDVRLISYQSMMDADTALAKGHVQASYTSLPRLVVLEEKDDEAASLALQPISLCHGAWWLVASPGNKAKKMEKLKERMVALERNSQSDWWSDQLMEQAKMEHSDIFRPQINDVSLRLQMVTDNLVDAAILPMPHAMMAELAGCRVLSRLSDSLSWMHCWATPTFQKTDTLRLEQQKLFLMALDMASEELNQQPDSSLVCNILSESFAFADTLADQMPLPRFGKAETPSETQWATVRQWLNSRKLQP